MDVDTAHEPFDLLDSRLGIPEQERLPLSEGAAEQTAPLYHYTDAPGLVHAQRRCEADGMVESRYGKQCHATLRSALDHHRSACSLDLEVLRLRSCDHRIYQSADGPRFLDCARSQFVPAGPEERVRQDVLRTLLEDYGYPLTTLRSEEPVARGTANRGRADVVVELPRNIRPGKVVVDGAAQPPSVTVPSYSDLVGQLREHLGELAAVQFCDVPNSIVVDVDGQRLPCTVLGFKGEGSGLGLWLRPTERSADLPDELCFWVLGHGLTDAERALARTLGLPHVLPTFAVTEAFQDWDLPFVFSPRLGMAPGASLPESADRGWIILHASGADRHGALATLNCEHPSWAEFIKAAMDGARRIPLAGELTAFRDRLDELSPGDRVIVSLDDFVEGAVLRAEGDRFVVDCLEHGVCTASPRFGEENWLVGRAGSGVEPESRADANHELEIAGSWQALIVVECKAPSVPYSEEVKQQGLRYARARGAEFLVLTNGSWTRSYVLTDSGDTEVEDVPGYAQVVSDDALRLSAVPPELPALPLPSAAERRPDAVRFHARYRQSIGAGVPEAFWRPILTFEDLLHRGHAWFREPQHALGITFAEDLGVREHAPGNLGGGVFRGRYRDFLLRVEGGTEVLFGIGVHGTLTTVEDPRWGNRSGSSMLIGCLSFGATYHPVLLCRLEKFMDTSDPRRVRFWHSGAATVGAGARKQSDVLAFVAKHEPQLVAGKRVQLGSVPTHANPEWCEVQDFFFKLARYVLIRHAYKEDVRRRRVPRTRKPT